MDKKSYYAEKKQDIQQDFSKLVEKSFNRFLGLANEIKEDMKELQIKLNEVEKREKTAEIEEAKNEKVETKEVVAPVAAPVLPKK